MANFKQLFMSYMDSQGVKYREIPGHDNVVSVTYTGNNMKSIPIYVFFDADGGNRVTLKCWDIGNFKDKMAAGIIACNELNINWRWVKFYIDKKGDVNSQDDAVIDESTCGSECLELVRRMVDIVDKAYPTFMHALYA